MSEQKKKLLENLAEITKGMSEDGLEKLQVFAAGVSAGAACVKPGKQIKAEAHESKPEKKEEENDQSREG